MSQGARVVQVVGEALACVAGLLACCYPMIFSGLARMQADAGDTRHLNYVVEHAYLWWVGVPAHADLWSPPMFWPQPGTGAYTDLLLGVAPFYMLFRGLGIAPDTSFQLFMMLSLVLDYLAALLLFRRGLGLSPLASASAAFLFAFGSVRANQIGHQQLVPHFYTVLAVYALARAFREPCPPARRRGFLALFFAASVLQVYASFYLAWLLVLFLAVAALVALGLASARPVLLGLLRRDAVTIGSLGLVSAAALWPLATHYLAAARAVGLPRFESVQPLLPSLRSFIYLGPTSWLYSGLELRAGTAFEWEKRLGLGILTSGLVLAGLWVRRRSTLARLAFVTSLLVALLVAWLPGEVSLWRFVFLLPGAPAVRAAGRIALVLLLPAGFGLGCAVEAMAERAGRAWRLVLPALLTGVFVEQGHRQIWHDKQEVRARVESLASAIPTECPAFYFAALDPDRRPVWEQQLDAMWAEARLGRPTVNGYSTNLPVGWPGLLDNGVRGDADGARLRGALSRWLMSHGRTPDAACFVLHRLPRPSP